MTKLGVDWFRHALVAALSLCVLLVASPSFAAGRVEWKAKTLKESDSHSWTVEVAIYLAKAPDVATMPMRFSFQPVVYYERTLVDGKEGPQLRRVPLEGRQPVVESVDVGFLDPGSGAIQKRTKFSFKLTRGNGYEAGEYDVSIKDGRSDQPIGNTTRIVFEGENDVIDRRAVVFSGEKKKKDKDEDATSESEEKPQRKELSPDDPGFWSGGPKSTENAENAEEVEPKRGCGCRIGAGDTHTDALGLFLMAAVAGSCAARRRR